MYSFLTLSRNLTVLLLISSYNRFVVQSACKRALRTLCIILRDSGLRSIWETSYPMQKVPLSGFFLVDTTHSTTTKDAHSSSARHPQLVIVPKLGKRCRTSRPSPKRSPRRLAKAQSSWIRWGDEPCLGLRILLWPGCCSMAAAVQ